MALSLDGTTGITSDGGTPVIENLDTTATGIAVTGELTVVANTTSDAVRITQTGTGNAFVVEDSTSPDGSPFAIDASGQVVVGHTVPLTVGGSPSRLQVVGSTGGAPEITIGKWQANATGPIVKLAKSRTATLGGSAVVQNNDVLGTIGWYGDDGTQFPLGASIAVAVDGTPSTNDMPGRLVFSTTADGASSPTERLRITSAGLVGIGTSSPDNKLTLASGYVQTGSGVGAVGGVLFPYADNAGTRTWRLRSDFHAYGDWGIEQATTRGGTAFVPRFLIDPSGNVLVNTVSAIAGGSGVLQVKGNPSYNAMQLQVGTNGNNGILFFNATAGAVGSIVVNSSSVAYNTSSDYRLKENWVAVADASTRVNALKPVNFAWKADGSRVDGFLAHELAEVVPEAVTGTKDAMRDEEYEVTPAVLDDEGAVVTPAVMGTRTVPEYQGIDQSKLVPLLTAALQEALAKIDDLTARVSALETA